MSEVNLSDAVIKVMHEIDKGNVKIDCELLAPALAAKDAEIAELKRWLQASRNVSQDLHYKCDDRAKEIRMLKSELADKDLVLAWYGDHNNYNHFPATSDPNCMAFVGFVEEKEAGDKAREVLQKYRKSEG